MANTFWRVRTACFVSTEFNLELLWPAKMISVTKVPVLASIMSFAKQPPFPSENCGAAKTGVDATKAEFRFVAAQAVSNARHEFGLKLSADDKSALIALLRTL